MNSKYKNFYLNFKMKKSGINPKQIEELTSILINKLPNNIEDGKNWKFNYISVRLRKPGARAAVVLRATNNKLDLAVKHFIPEQGEVTHTAIREFQILEQVYSSLPASFKHIIPKPIYATTDAYAAEWVNLPSMKSRLAWARFNSVTRLSCLRAAAGALKAIHQAGMQPAIPLELSTYITAARCSAAPDPSWDRNLDHFINILSRFDGVKVPHCRAHGDYSPENILFSPKRTVVIDFAYDAISPIYRDICHFIMYFSVYC
ncbi:MAG: aminoglycoside phosphotransferase family protein, partial [Anderseniella sp.]